MKKSMIVGGVLAAVLFLASSQAFAGGRAGLGYKEGIGVPPEAMVRVSNITRHRGKGELFYPAIDLLTRIESHYIQPGDKEPGPGWGVPEGHNIGNAPKPRVVGKHLDRTERGKAELIVDFLKRIEEHEKQKR